MAAAQRQLGRNLKWAMEHLDVMDRYEGRWVAVDGGKVIAVADSMAALHKRFAKRPGVLLHYCDPPDQGWLLRVGTA
jgi:hypothetical protein